MTTEATSAPAANTPSSEVAAPSAETTAAPVTPAAEAIAPATPATTETTTAPAAVEPAAPALKAPEKYEFKTPEAQTLNPAVVEKFESIARELDLSNEQAQKMIDTVAPQMLEAQKAAHLANVAAWETAAKADPEFGGEKLTENLATAKAALDKFGTPALSKMLAESGLGNHPEIIRAFYNAGKQLSNGSFVPSGSGTSQNASLASKLYPDMK